MLEDVGGFLSHIPQFRSPLMSSRSPSVSCGGGTSFLPASESPCWACASTDISSRSLALLVPHQEPVLLARREGLYFTFNSFVLSL